MKKVMVFGSFDVLHDGHRSLFEQAKQYGDHLIAVVARDDTYEALRLYTPVHSEDQRLSVVLKEPFVDTAVLGDRIDIYRAIKQFRPDVICLGYDQKHFVDGLDEKLASLGLATSIMRLKPFYPETFKSSLLKKGDGYLPDV